MNQLKSSVLIVEDEMLIAAKISLHLHELGYEVTGMIPRGEEALIHCEENTPDIVLLDIQLKGELDGIETALALRNYFDVSIIFITANTDEKTFDRAKEAQPDAFLAKPYIKLDLQRAIELSISRKNQDNIPETLRNVKSNNSHIILNDRIFIRDVDKRLRIFNYQILYIESDRNYSIIFTQSKKFTLATTLKIIEQKLSSPEFLRVHRSYVVNLKNIDAVAENHLVIDKKVIPVSKSMKSELMRRLKVL